ncbi:hypothetical protein DAETH_43260 (plasmid) [Deinococcus aetherius]|uniref:Uncharacterized protein n=1 Tax=Deinococcus aetherius TaxID=200252 RepID=A0ABN6RM26_9DEIO|nr:hypothetical protein [Deinococcus aetherius]BDP44357.1 hypothetical protein DAETH_43260 [Deinococcus aetherius]
MTPPGVLRWHVLIRWADGHRSRFVYEGPLWIGKVSQDVHVLAQAEHARRREASPDLPPQLPYEVLSFREAGKAGQG